MEREYKKIRHIGIRNKYGLYILTSLTTLYIYQKIGFDDDFYISLVDVTQRFYGMFDPIIDAINEKNPLNKPIEYKPIEDKPVDDKPVKIVIGGHPTDELKKTPPDNLYIKPIDYLKNTN